MKKNYLFTSQRLGFRNWEMTDLVAFAALNADEEVMRFFPSPLSTEQTRQMIQKLQQRFERDGITFYAVEKLANQEFIGMIGLVKTDFKSHFTPCTEIGWRLKKEAWHQGYATEGAKACLQYAFETLKIEAIYSFTATVNKPSEKVMQRIGMQQVGSFNHPKIPKAHELCKHVLYKIDNPNLR